MDFNSKQGIIIYIDENHKERIAAVNSEEYDQMLQDDLRVRITIVQAFDLKHIQDGYKPKQ